MRALWVTAFWAAVAIGASLLIFWLATGKTVW